MKNKFIIDGETTRVILSSKDGDVESLIETKSLEILNDFEGTFRAIWNDNTKSYYAMGYDKRYGKNKNVMMHRWILAAQEGTVVDHINHDTLDNRRSNLRITSQSENMTNLDARKLQGRVPGVRWYEGKKKWRVTVMVKGVSHHLGYFVEKSEAIKVLEEFKKEMK